MDERRDSGVGPEAAPPVPGERPDPQRPYHAPALERLAEWKALTLQQTIGLQ